ncbi:MAG: HdeD family acid-resistance protein [Hyphomicrobiales bacterium]|nr:HdeD family acid-resistance protein [Hyphomicrobiales bacterium]
MANGTEQASFEATIKENKSLLLWTGIAFAIVGALAIFFPILSSFTANFMVGWLFIISGVVMGFNSFTIQGTGPFFGALLLGLITLIAGIYLLANPEVGLVVLTLTIAIVFIFEGAYQTVAAFELRPAEGWGWLLVSAIISIVVGLLIVSRLPGASLVVLGLLMGINFLSSGLSMIMLSRSAA